MRDIKLNSDSSANAEVKLEEHYNPETGKTYKLAVCKECGKRIPAYYACLTGSGLCDDCEVEKFKKQVLEQLPGDSKYRIVPDDFHYVFDVLQEAGTC